MVLWSIPDSEIYWAGGFSIRLTYGESDSPNPILHVSLLKKVVSSAVSPQPLPHMLTDDLELQVEPAAVIAVRYSSSGMAEVLIQWEDHPDFEATWESADVIQ